MEHRYTQNGHSMKKKSFVLKIVQWLYILIASLKSCSAFENRIPWRKPEKKRPSLSSFITLVPAKRQRCNHRQDILSRAAKLDREVLFQSQRRSLGWVLIRQFPY